MRVLLAAVASLFIAGTAQAADMVQVGRLSCDVAGGVGLILGSSKDVTCTFKRKDHDAESYTGEINKLGIDIGVTEKSHIEWLVFAAADRNIDTGALAGTYLGASAEATVGVGLGGNVLIGGFEKSFALQPFSVQAQTGLNIAVGVAGLTLR